MLKLAGNIDLSQGEHLLSEDDMNMFNEAEAIQACMRLLMSTAKNLRLSRTQAALAEVIEAVEADMYEYCN